VQDVADWQVAGAIVDVGMAPWGIGGADSGEARLRHALELVPDHLEALNLLAQLYAQTSRHRKALELLDRVVAATAARPADLVLIGGALAETYEGRGDFRRARAVYERCLKAVTHPDLLNGLGYCLAKLNDLAGAIRHAEAASRLAPDRADLLNDWAWSLVEAGRPTEALPLLKRAVAIDPGYELALRNLEHCRRLLAPPAGRARRDRVGKRKGGE
jgi:tetratricopeptide (TPR) repeat protein